MTPQLWKKGPKQPPLLHFCTLFGEEVRRATVQPITVLVGSVSHLRLDRARASRAPWRARTASTPFGCEKLSERKGHSLVQSSRTRAARASPTRITLISLSNQPLEALRTKVSCPLEFFLVPCVSDRVVPWIARSERSSSRGHVGSRTQCSVKDTPSRSSSTCL